MNADIKTVFHLIPMLILTSFTVSTLALEVSISDPGLNAAIRDALQEPEGPLTEQDLLSLTVLEARGRNVGSIEGLEAARNLVSLDLQSNLLSNFSLPSEFTNLVTLDVSLNSLTNCSLPSGLTNLAKLELGANRLANFTLPPGLTGLADLNLENNQLTSFNLPSDLTSLVLLDLGFNSLTNFSLPSGLTNLTVFTIAGNLLTNLTLPGDLTGLTELNLSDNQLTSLTLPPDMQQLDSFFVDGNPLTTLVLSEPLAATKLAVEVASLQDQGVSVFTYPLAVSLISPRLAAGAFELTLTGPPGIYTVFASSDLASWSELGVATNLLGSAVFTDATAGLSAEKLYRARQ